MEDRKLVECPFYVELEKHHVQCEGIEEGSSLQVNFISRKDRLAFMDRYCRSMDWEKCPIAKMLYAKYEEEV